ncbi:chalcone isomerase family protein [Ferrimonas aestuarii]|uniref:Chalcone isomerase domain-containing protein n=1 Tax=Ferrimonas aestuarii TaxID=2569539 RepID=A0A4U1BSF8_9GAMM|nr:chalcone isomerase family protein [Ferrimonas aestuarii]TKB56557.1 hypothetical protein FCL42_05340 [Ferrimonas aestuarii]
MKLLPLLAMASITLSAHASNPASAYQPLWQSVGSGTLKVMFWRIYTARLYSDNGQFGRNEALKLSLTYHREIEGQQLWQATDEQWQRLGFASGAHSNWLNQYQHCFPDVNKGDTLSFIWQSDGSAEFHFNHRSLCQLPVDACNRDFLEIWLSSDSAYPEMTAQLINRSNQ